MSLSANLVAALPCQDTQPITALVDPQDAGNSLTPSFIPTASSTSLAFGRNLDDSSQAHQGAVFAMAGKWDRALSGSDITTLYNSGSGSLWSAISGGSLNDAKFYLNFDEAGGSTTIADKTGRGNTFTVFGSMTSTTGPGGSGAGASFATGNYCYIASNADVRLPASNGSCSATVWVKLTSLTPVTGQVTAIMSKWTGLVGSKSPEYGIYLNRHSADASALWQIDVGSGVDDNPDYCNNTATSGTSHPSAGTWYFLGMVYDAAANEVKLYVNGTLETTLGVVSMPDMVSALGGLAAKFSNTVWDGVSGSGYDVSGSRHASVASTADWGLGNTNGTIGFWFRRTRSGGFNEELMVKGTTSNAFDWDFRFSSDTLYFEISDGGGANFRYAGWGSTITDTSWHCVMGWHDSGVTYISVDNGTPVTGTATGSFTPATNTHPFYLGSDGDPSVGKQSLVELRSIYKWTDVKDSTDRTAFYNAGSPVDYPFGAASGGGMAFNEGLAIGSGRTFGGRTLAC